jgi:hypothetical protein
MSLIGTIAEAAEQIAMPGEWTAEIPAINAKVGAAAKLSHPAARWAAPEVRRPLPTHGSV